MRVISDIPLRQFCERHPEARESIQAWRAIVLKTTFPDFASFKKAFNAIDKVGNYYVFDIGGNKYRLIAAIHFDTQKLFVREVFTHREYDKWKP